MGRCMLGLQNAFFDRSPENACGYCTECPNVCQRHSIAQPRRCAAPGLGTVQGVSERLRVGTAQSIAQPRRCAASGLVTVQSVSERLRVGTAQSIAQPRRCATTGPRMWSIGSTVAMKLVTKHSGPFRWFSGTNYWQLLRGVDLILGFNLGGGIFFQKHTNILKLRVSPKTRGGAGARSADV